MTKQGSATKTFHFSGAGGIPRDALEVFKRDLLADKRHCGGPCRSDAHRFTTWQNGHEFIRIPISYLLKLALADTLSPPEVYPLVRATCERYMSHFSNDNTSPETFSFPPEKA